MINASTLVGPVPSEKILHDPEIDNRLSTMEMRLVLLWQKNYRTVPELFKAYNLQYPDDQVVIGTIGNALTSLKKKALSFNRKELREQLMFEYEILYKEAYQAWLDSKLDEVVITDTREESEKGYKETSQERRVAQVGDPRHWKNASHALEQMRAMVGVDEPKRVEAIIRREMDIILQYLESTLLPKTFNEVMGALVQYEDEKGS